MFLAVLQVLRSNGADERVGWIAVRQQRADGQQHFGDGQSWRPIILENVQTDDPLTVDVAVVDPRSERHLGRLEGVLWREVNVEEEDASFVDGARWTENRRYPLVQIVALGAGTAVGRWIERDLGQLLLYPVAKRKNKRD